MKRQILKTFATLGFFAALAVTSAHAQTSSVQTASIPFDFTVGDRTLPAGEYHVERLNPQSDPAAVALRSQDGKVSVNVLTMPRGSGKAKDAPRLVFNRYGQRHFLAQIWRAADTTGMELPTSRAERRLRRELQMGTAPAQTTVALVSRNR